MEYFLLRINYKRCVRIGTDLAETTKTAGTVSGSRAEENVRGSTAGSQQVLQKGTGPCPWGNTS
jgi:hypothetical protein